MPSLINLVGKKFERLTVISFVGRNIHKQRLYECLCACGNIVIVVSGSLTQGNTHSCGCFKLDRISEVKTIHGESHKTKEYEAWKGIIKRCYNTKTTQYKDYGGRGVTVCDRWRHSYENFLADMGRAPSSKHSLDRKENQGIYEPDNCRWATKIEQMNNTRRNIMIDFTGELKTLPDWCRLLGLNYNTVRRRVCNYGWAIEKSLTTPTNTLSLS